MRRKRDLARWKARRVEELSRHACDRERPDPIDLRADVSRLRDQADHTRRGPEFWTLRGPLRNRSAGVRYRHQEKLGCESADRANVGLDANVGASDWRDGT